MRRLQLFVCLAFLGSCPATLLAADVSGDWTLSWPYADSTWSFSESSGTFSAGVGFPQSTESWNWHGSITGPVLVGMYAANRAIPPGPVDAGNALALTSRDLMAGVAISTMGNGIHIFCGRRAATTSAPARR